MGSRLAGQIKSESEIPHSMLEQKNVMNVLHTVGKSYVAQAYLNAGKKDLHDAVNITTQMRSIWSVSQYENEYNPSHNHTGCEISGVIYLKTPDIKGRRKIPSKEGKRDNDGDIAFPYSSECQRNGELLSKGILQVAPSRGLMLIFPSWLLHTVYPFKGDEERRSIAFNANYQVFSPTGEMREDGGDLVIGKAIEKLEPKHQEHIEAYGQDNDQRLTGLHETCDIDTFRWGVSDRGASIRVPWQVHRDGKGYLEDRRPSSNCDPYLVAQKLVETICS